MARKEKLDAAYSIITGESKKTTRATTSKPLGVVLTAEQITRLDQIAADLQTNRHRILQYAVADFIRRYDAGEKPKMRTETKKVLDF